MRLRHRLVAWAVAAWTAAPSGASAQAIAALERELLPLREGILRDAPGVDGTLWESLARLRALEDRQRSLRGNVTFGLTGDEAGSRSLFKLNTGVSLSRGVFPSEIAVSTFLGLQLANGRVQEDVTSLKISYDYHTSRRLQYFAFAERFSDNFLSIQQRYEVGFGASVGVDVGSLGEVAAIDQQFAHLRRNLPGVWAAVAALAEPAQSAVLASGALDPARVDRALESLGYMVRDEQARLFVGVAASVFAEIEQASLEVVSLAVGGILPAATDTIGQTFDLEGARRYRLNIRPTLRLRPTSQIAIRVFPYWKLPLDGPRHATLPGGGRRFDYRRDVLSEMSWNIRPEDSGVESVAFVFAFNHFYDNAPPSLPSEVVADAAAAGRVFDRLSAEQAHRSVSMSLRVQW